MSIYRRRQQISTILQKQGEVTIEELSRQLEVSENTIRNDLTAMQNENVLRRIRGGAILIEGGLLSQRTTLVKRGQTYRDEKRLIGRWAATLVEDDDTIILDAGSTIYHLATFLTDRNNLTVLTNGIDVAVLLAKNPSNKVILASNVVRSDGVITTGNLHPMIHKRFFASKYFVSCHGFSIDQGLADPDVDEAAIKTQMLEVSQQVIALIDSSKFGIIAPFNFAALDQIHLLVTDAPEDDAYLKQILETGHFPVVSLGRNQTKTLNPTHPLQQQIFRIGFGNLTDEMPFAQQVRDSLIAAAEHMGHIELLIRDNAVSRETALANADWFVESGVDLVIEYQMDSGAGNVIMDKFNRAQIPAIAVDIAMPGATFFGADNYRSGYLAGENLGHWINKHWRGQFDILLNIGTSRPNIPVSARMQGLQEGLENIVGTIPHDHIITLDWPILLHEVEQTVTEIIPRIAPGTRVAVIGLNDDAAVGALNAFEQAGRLDQIAAVGQGVDVTGRAALCRENFPFVGSTRYAPEEYGEKLLNLAMKILRGEPIPPAVYIQHTFINKDNLREYYPVS
jgi:ribose transport system substrate-binding protein